MTHDQSKGGGLGSSMDCDLKFDNRQFDKAENTNMIMQGRRYTGDANDHRTALE